ncbi:MAG: mechanosensitive ion channel family protein [Candidatus Poseidoniales archaeon]|nr:mechanosensitive ion channel family protein [Candidatus Poseidoniales archaeon]
MQSIVEAIPGHDKEIYGVSVDSVIAALILLIFIIIVREIMGLILPKIFTNISLGSEVAKNALASSGKALGVAGGCWGGMYLIEDMDWVMSSLQLVMVVALVVTAFRFVGVIHAFVLWTDDDGVLDGSQKTVVSAAESIMKFLIVVFGMVFIADALGFDLTTMVAGLGITGLALALAAQDTISNIFGATTVLLDRPFQVGDWIVIGSVEGEVMEIGLRTTLIRTSLDTVVTMPNANLANTPVENWGKRRFRRWQPIFKLDINSDPTQVSNFCDGVADLIASHEKTMKEEDSFARVSALGPDAIDIGCNIYWNINSGKVEREARDGFLIEVMELAKTHDLNFHDNRRRHSV